MICAARGVFREFRKCVSKKGNSFNMLDLGASDYRPVSMFVPDDKIHLVENLKEGDAISVQFTLESRMSGLSATLQDIEKK